MLMKAVDQMFWLGRYLERLDDTARLVIATSHLLMDSHEETQFGWPVLLEVLGQSAARLLRPFADAQGRLSLADTERAVMALLITEADSPVSILATSAALKRNARSLRPLLPREMWEELNALDLFLRDSCSQTVSRQQRYQLMAEVSRRCQMVIGVLDGTMLRGDAFDLLNMGRHLERADMTTRIMDVMVLQQLQPTQIKRPKFRWISLLNGLGGVESYQRFVASQTREVDAIDYLLACADFPRSISYCLNRIASSAKQLPHAPSIADTLLRVQQHVKTGALGELSTVQLHGLIDELQTGIIDLHQVILSPCFALHAAQQRSA